MPKTKSIYFQRQQQKGKLQEFEAVSGFEFGYRNREDVTTLNPKVLVAGSKNILTSTNGTVGNRRGYTLDGPANKDNHPVVSSYDWTTNQAFERNLRYTNHKLQYRNVDSAGVVTWRDLITLTGDMVNFAEFWDDNAAHNAENLSLLLFVDGTSNIYMWTGGIANLSARTTNSLTLNNATTWADAGFLTGSGYTKQVVINGTTYTYTGGATTDTLTGVTPDPSGEALNSVVHQAVVTTSNNQTATVTISNASPAVVTWNNHGLIAGATVVFSTTGTLPSPLVAGTFYYVIAAGLTTNTFEISATKGGTAINTTTAGSGTHTAQAGNLNGVPFNFKPVLIASQSNQIYIASANSFSVFVSQFNSFRDFSYSSPRLVGEGAQLTFKGVPTAIITQDSDVYISAGKDFWYRTAFQLSADLTKESLSRLPLKTGPLQAAQSQGLTCKIKNKVAFVSFEPIVNTLGIDQNILIVPQVDDISSPIVNDVNEYDFTGGHMTFYRKNLYIAIPREGRVIVFNMTQDDLKDDESPRYYWEAPQELGIGRLAIIGGELYGHSSTDGETFKLFDGWNDNGHRINARAVFAYNSNGSRNLRKSSDSLFIEGRIASNTTLSASLRREVNGSVAVLPLVEGTNTAIVGSILDDASLGKEKIGSVSLGSSNQETPPVAKFRVYLTYPRTPYFEEQPTFESDGVDQRWELLNFSTNASPASEKPTDITL